MNLRGGNGVTTPVNVEKFLEKAVSSHQLIEDPNVAVATYVSLPRGMPRRQPTGMFLGPLALA